MKKAIIYLRVSTDEQVKGFSLQAQKDECTKKAEELGCEKIYEFTDEGISGSIRERPALMEALEKIRKNDISYFIVLDSSRLSRNTAHQLILIEQFKKNHCKLIFLRSNIEDTPEGKLQLTIMSAIDEYERARFQLRSELGKRVKASLGKLTHSPNLYGYHFNKDTDLLSVNEIESKIIKKMFEWVVQEELGPASISKRLNEMGVPSPRNKLWHKTTVKRILDNTAYTGTLFIRRYDTRETKFNKYKKEEEKVSRKEKPREEWVPISIQSIIDEELWNKAKNVLNRARRKRSGNNKANYLLSGLLRCAKCESTLHGNLTSNKNKKKYRYYVCTAQSPGIIGKQKCDLGFIKASELEETVWTKIVAWINNPEELRNKMECLPNDELKKKEELEELSIYLESLNNEKDKLINLYQKNLIEEIEVEKRLRDVTEKTKQIIRKKEILYKNLKNQSFTEKNFIKIEEKLKFMQDNLKNINFETRKKITASLIEEIVVFSHDIKINVKLPD